MTCKYNRDERNTRDFHLNQINKKVKFSTNTFDSRIKWNPSIDEDCSDLLVDWWVCVGLLPQGADVKFAWFSETPDLTEAAEPTKHTQTSHMVANSVFVPSPSHGPMPSSCQAYHLAETSQSCRDIVAQYGIFTQKEFLEWNPALNGACDSVRSGNYYCVANFGDSARSLPQPSHVTKAPARLPYGSRRGCESWYKATGGDDCALIAKMFGTFDEESFINWNPSVKKDCRGIKDDVWYCVAKKNTPTTRSGDIPSLLMTASSSRPTQAGVSNKCADWWLVGPRETCKSVRRKAGISHDDLIAWNPAIGADCAGMEEDKYICVGIDGEDDNHDNNDTDSSQSTTTDLTEPSSTSKTVLSTAESRNTGAKASSAHHHRAAHQ